MLSMTKNKQIAIFRIMTTIKKKIPGVRPREQLEVLRVCSDPNGTYLSLECNKCSHTHEGGSVKAPGYKKILYVACAMRTSLHENRIANESCAQRTLHFLCFPASRKIPGSDQGSDSKSCESATRAKRRSAEWNPKGFYSALTPDLSEGGRGQ